MLLKKGDKNENVKKLQEKLNLTPDGSFGAKTEEAVKHFQTKNNLVADGIVGDKTWNLIINTPVITTSNTSNLKLEKLKGHIPDAVITQLPDTIAKFELNTSLRLAHFLAQVGHESGGFKAVNENLNYSAKGLLTIFKKYFSDETTAKLYERKPEKIANIVYASRMGNGDKASGEGWKFRGRGYIQLTGKNNYTAFNAVVPENLLESPDLVATKYPLLSAGWFFHKNGLHKIADKGATDAVVTEVTKRVNGGTIGLADRIKHFKEYYALLA